MIPVLYPSTETSFTTNGLGGLPDAISCVVTEQRNTQGGYWLEMEYPVDGLHYDLLAPERIIYAAPSMGNTPQPFRISRITRPINGIVHIEAPHISAQLQKITTSGTFTARSFTGITYDYAQAARGFGQTFPFFFSSDKTFTETQISFPEPTAFMDILLGAEGSILDTFGGEYEWNGREVILHDSRGVDSGLEIRYGVNMSDLEAETDATELVTACVPFWKGTVNEQDVIVTGDMCTADNASAYAYVRCVPLDVTEQFDLEQDQQPTAAQVTAKGQAFINSTSRKLLQTSIRVSYEPTTSGIGERRINLCDTVRVVYPDLNVSSISKVVETKFNVLIERYDELTIGTIRNNIVDTIAGLISGGVTYSGGGSGSGGGGSAVGAVLYNMPQNLNEAQKAQARSNIGVGSGGDVEVNFPVYTPQDFGAVGDMEHDDTQAFKDAFAASSRGGTVFVPDGRYRLTDTIKIPRWGMMVLSGSVELRFFNMEDGSGGWKPCIKLLLYARLKGNGSLVIVDYNYKGHAIELYTDEDPLHQPNEPFVGSNPSWRQSRDVDEIAVLKRASPTNAETSVVDIRNIGGDAIYIGAPTKTEFPHTNAATSRNFQWTAHVNARIAGGFENGFHLELKDKNDSWMSDTFISGVVENTETAVLIERVTGGVYCDVTFQPLLCYPTKLPTWASPASEEDAYDIGDRVHYPSSNSPIYESTISNNMGAPDGTGWKRAEEYVDDVRHLLPVWDSAKAPYQTGDRVHYPTENDPVYESDTDNNTSVPTGSGWHRAVQYVSDEPFRYVKNGVKVVSTANVDMTRTKIWDWQNALHDVPDKDGNYSHQPYALIGSSRSAIIYDYGMDNSRLPFHSRIYSNGIGNILTATIKSAFGLLPVPPKYAFYKNYRSEDSVYNYLNLAWRDPQNLMRFQMPFKPLYPVSNANQLYQLGYFDFADAEVPQSGINDTLVRQTITIEENDDRGLYGYTNLYFEENVAEARWNPVGYGTGGHIPIYYYSTDGTRRYIYRLVRDNTDIQQIYNCQLYITNARRFIFDFQTIGEIGSLSADTYKLIQPQTANADLYLAGSVTVQNGVPMVCTESAVFGRDGRPTTAATVKPIALAEDAYQILDYIEGDGASYINTGIVPSATTKIMARFNAASVAAVTSAERQYIFGTYSTVNGDTESRAQFCYGGSDFSSPSRAFAGFGGGVSGTGYNYFAITPDTDEHYINLSKDKVLFDDLWKLTLDNENFTDPKSIYLFACNENGAANHFSKGIQIEAVSIYDGDTRLARFLPALRKADGALGMLDEDSGEFFPNMGTGVFRNDTVEPPFYNVTLNADGTVNTFDSALTYSAASASVLNGKPKKLIVTWGNSLFTADADEKLSGANGDVKFIADCEHDGIQRHMIFTLTSANALQTTLIETYSRVPATVWEVADVTQGLIALNTNISSSLAWQLTNLNLSPFKRIKVYAKAGRKTGAMAADSSIVPAAIIEMLLDDRAKETVSQNVFIGSAVVQNPNDSNRLGLLTCAVSADKTKFAVVRATSLYGTAATSNTDCYQYVFKIEGYYD